MSRTAARTWIAACLLAALAASCRSPDDDGQAARDRRDAFEAQLDADG